MFEGLAYSNTIEIEDFPEKWVPLIYPYDPDLPLFPIYYFHELLVENWDEYRPSETDRVYGYMNNYNFQDGTLFAEIISNKNFNEDEKAKLKATNAICDRLGITNKFSLSEISNSFTGELENRNLILREIWFRTIDKMFGHFIPYGKLWDPVLGIARFYASYRSGGRKGEFIQTHYFLKFFGEEIQNAGGLPNNDFHLLPTIEELTHQENPLNIFPKFRVLLSAIYTFCDRHCILTELTDDFTLTSWDRTQEVYINFNRRINTELMHSIFDDLPEKERWALYQLMNAMNKGPGRSLACLMFINDLRQSNIPVGRLNDNQHKAVRLMSGLHQFKKVIEIYFQQCFADPEAMPVDEWVRENMKWPFKFWGSNTNRFVNLLDNLSSKGLVERVIWYTSQARKVHSSACDDALWCIKLDRGANPLSCKICLESIRNVCPSYETIIDKQVGFNLQGDLADFRIITSAGNNNEANQNILSTSGESIYGNIVDHYSVEDSPHSYNSFPNPRFNNGNVDGLFTVREFVENY